MANYVLANIPSQLWFAFRNRADEDRWDIRALLLQLMQDYVDGKIRPSTNPPPRPDGL
jgi:hypothetical protein